jgi:ABC-type spermidine/putrescine transport system permease subunit II
MLGAARRKRSRLTLAIPAVALVTAGLLVPVGVLAVYSFRPTSSTGHLLHSWSLTNYAQIFQQSVYLSVLLHTVEFVGLAALLTTVLTFPVAYFVAIRVPPQRRTRWLLLCVAPFMTSYLIRVFAWINIFGDHGVANSLLLKSGLIQSPLSFLGLGTPAIVITFVYLLFPLTFLTTYVALERADPALRECASDLGANGWRTLLRVTVPLARTGLLTGFALAFMTMLGDYITPTLIGGVNVTFFSSLIVLQFGVAQQWGFGAALTFVMLATVVILLVIARRATGSVEAAGEYTHRFEPRRALGLRAYSALFVIFLYLPIAAIVVFAFNSAPYVGLPIKGFTTHWFGDVFSNPQIVSALETSLKIAAGAVAIGVVLGALAAIPLASAKGKRRGAALVVISLPLFVPPVVLGLGIVIGLNDIHVARGPWLITVAHGMLILPLVTLMTIARLEGLPANQEAAAMDLGARPWQALVRITLPQALPAIAAAAMIGFALSMDEFILTFLITGSTTTLPLYIYSALRFELDPSLCALATILFGVTLSLLLLARACYTGLNWGRRREGRAPALSAPLNASISIE